MMRKKYGLILGVVLAAAVSASLFLLESPGQDEGAKPAEQAASHPNQQPMDDLPWRIEKLPSGATRVFGLTLSTRPLMGSTLADAQRRWASGFSVAVVTEPGRGQALEGLVEAATLGFITGRLVVVAGANPQALQDFCARAARTEVLVDGTRRCALNAADVDSVLRLPIVALTFIPQIDLDEDILKTRFGEPAKRVRSNTHAEQWLYPDKGLDIMLDSEGKEVLRYVAPARFGQQPQPLPGQAAFAERQPR